MSLRSQLQAALAGWPPFDSQEQLVRADHDGVCLACRLVMLDRVGCAFTLLEVTTPRLAGADPPRLQAVGRDLAGRLNYLLEPISVIEVDAQGHSVQLRSQPPQQSDDAVTYYELLARRDGTLALCRYQKLAAGARQRVPAEVTREVLLRLADDLGAAGR